MQAYTRTPDQQKVVEILREGFGLSSEDAEAILFLDDKKPLKPWYPSDVALAIARQSAELRSVEAHYVNYIEPLQQIINEATVIDSKGRSFTCPGVAKLGEKLPNEETLNEQGLAKSRAINGALDMAGFNPLKVDAEVLDLKLPKRESSILDDAAARSKDIRQIHAIAWEKGLIKPYEDDPRKNDCSGYFDFLTEKFHTDTSGDMKPVERAQLINALNEYEAPKAQVA